MNEDLELLSLADLSADDKQIVDDLLRSREQLAEILPDDMDSGQLWTSLAACCKTLSLYRRSSSALKVVVGRLLVVLEDRPEIYKDRGYRHFDDFLTRGMPHLFGIPRSEAYAARALVASWPSLTPTQLQSVSYQKLALISKFTNESSADANKYLSLCQMHSFSEMKDICANNGVLPREESDFAEITILTTKGIKDQFEAFIRDPRIRAHVGSDSPGEILSMVMGDFQASMHMQPTMLAMEEQAPTAWIVSAPPAEA